MKLLLIGTTIALIQACSVANREGPNVSCADLQGGKRNACQQGIIASCPNGKSVRYQVCTDAVQGGDPASICEESWQTLGSYSCSHSGGDASAPTPDAGMSGSDTGPVMTGCNPACIGTLTCSQTLHCSCGQWYSDNDPPNPSEACSKCIGEHCCPEATACGVNTWGTSLGYYRSCVSNSGQGAAACESSTFDSTGTDPTVRALHACITKNSCPGCIQ